MGCGSRCNEKVNRRPARPSLHFVRQLIGNQAAETVSEERVRPLVTLGNYTGVIFDRGSDVIEKRLAKPAFAAGQLKWHYFRY
jgi:hypothetical protein